MSADRADRVNERGHTRVVELEAEIGSLRARLAEAEAKLATCAAALEQTVRERDTARARLAKVERERDAAQAECISIARRVSETYFAQRDEARRERDAARTDAARERERAERAEREMRQATTALADAFVSPAERPYIHTLGLAAMVDHAVAHHSFHHEERAAPNGSLPVVARDEAWCHAACLSIAEAAPGWDGPPESFGEWSAAMAAVQKLRRDLATERAAREKAEADRGWDESGPASKAGS